MGPAYIDRRAKQATKLDITNMMSARRRSRQLTAFHRLAALLSVPLTVRVLVFGVVVVVITSVPAPIGSLFDVPISTSTAIFDTLVLLRLFLSLSSSSTLLSADVDVRDEDVGREQIDGERPATFE